MIEMYEAGTCFDHCRWEGQRGRCVQIEFAPADLEAMTHGAVRVAIGQTRHELFDAEVSHLALELARQAAATERAREVRRRFIGEGTPYTPQSVNFYDR